WFAQEYSGEVELLFGVASEDDPVCDVVRQLMAKYPQRQAELILATPSLGANSKVSKLSYLFRKAKFDHLILSDADVFIPPRFFPDLIQGLRDEKNGIVNCFYIQAATQTLPMRFEAVAGNADFWTHVLQATGLKPMDFALGAVMALRKGDLEQIGGFESLVDFLADDYELGNRIAGTGKKLLLSTTPVECRSEAYGWKDMWQHQVRWGRTIRVCRPVAYFFSILGNGTVWPLLAFFTAGPMGRWLFGSMFAARMLAAVSNYARLTKRWEWWVAPITPLQDIGQLFVWIVSFLGNVVVWRGERFRVHSSGKLTRLA
ncbi:MAG TPA: glycosyltransferase, partial [Candidatus Kapabacteria bacterium]|nr:glycosyltransferase [Candidatus Kapabacteria bacterium]